MNEWRVLVAGDPPTAGKWGAVLSRHVRVAGQLGSVPGSYGHPAHGTHALVVAGADTPAATAALVRQWQLTCPGTPIIVGLSRPDFDTARLAQAAGAAYALVLPDEAAHLPRLLDSLSRAGWTAPAAAKPPGRAVVVYCPQSGCGVTTLTALLGGALQQATGSPVLVVDMDSTWGGLETVLGLTPERSWLALHDLIRAGELTGPHVTAVSTEHASGLRLLASPADGTGEDRLSEPEWLALLAAVRSAHPVSVWDMPPQLLPWRYPALWGSFDLILAVTAPLIPAVCRVQRMARRLAEPAAVGLPPVRLVHCREGLDPALRLADVLKVVALPAAGQVREDVALARLPVTRRWPFAVGSRRPSGGAGDVQRLAATLRETLT